MINFMEVAKTIADKYSVPIEKVLSRRRYSELVAIRKEIIVALREQRMSQSAIARFLGHKDHTTVAKVLKGRVPKPILANNK